MKQGRLDALSQKLDKIKAQKEKIKQIESQVKARIQAVVARKTTQERKSDTRRKILVGAMVLEEHQKVGSMAACLKKLDKFLKKKADRDLFGLPPIGEA